MRDQANPTHRAAFNAMRDDLSQRFPLAFPAVKQPRPALALGTRNSLIEALGGSYSTDQVGCFLKLWCNRPRYLMTIAAGGPRVDLAGQEVGTITPYQRLIANDRLKARRQRRLEKERGRVQRKLARAEAATA